MIAYRAVDFIPHLWELPLWDAAFVVDEIVIEFDTQSWAVQIAFQEDAALGHHKRLFDVAFPHGGALHIGRSSLYSLE